MARPPHIQYMYIYLLRTKYIIQKVEIWFLNIFEQFGLILIKRQQPEKTKYTVLKIWNDRNFYWDYLVIQIILNYKNSKLRYVVLIIFSAISLLWQTFWSSTFNFFRQNSYKNSPLRYLFWGVVELYSTLNFRQNK